MSDFDAGHGYVDEQDRGMTLTPEEKKKLEEMREVMNKAASEYTFFMREFQSNPKPCDFHVNCKLTKGLVVKFKWLSMMLVKPGWCTQSALLGRIIAEGIKAVYADEQTNIAAGMMLHNMLEQELPPELLQRIGVSKLKRALAELKKVEEKKFKDSLGENEVYAKE